MTKIVIKLEELVCPMCATKIETALKKQKGITDVSVLYNSSKANVSFDENITTKEKITEVINNVGYDIISIK